MTTFEVRLLNQSDYSQWDTFVERAEHSTVFQSSSWITTAAEMHRFSPVLIGVFQGGELISGCSFYREDLFHIYKKGTTEETLTPYGGLILPNPKSTHVRECESREHEIISLILEKIQLLNLSNVTLTNAPGLVDMRPFIRNGWKETVRYCYIFPLTGDIDERISKKSRWSVNKAKKAGIVVRQKWDMDLFWDLALNTYKKQGIQPPFSCELLFAFLKHIKNTRCGDMWIAETASGEKAAAEIFLWDAHMSYRWQAASHTDYKDTDAPTLLLSEVMRHVQEKGFQKFNMMAANTPNLAKFISGFNPELVPYYSVQKIRGIYRIPGIIRSLLRR